MKKGLVLGIIALFISVSITPSSGNMMSSDDTTPPVTTHTLDPLEPNGLNGWYISDVTITLEAYDDMSGVNTTYYSVNSEPWEIFNEPFILSEDGPLHLVYFSVDNSGNMEFPKLARLKMDRTPPKVDLTAERKGSWRWNPPPIFSYIAVATDETSGMERAEFYLNEGLEKIIPGPGPIYTWSLLPPAGPPFIFKVCVFDYAGQCGFDIYEGFPPVDSLFFQFLERFPLLREVLSRVINR